MPKVSSILRRVVAARANQRCEYCQIPQAFLATKFHIEHIRAIKHGGSSVLDNLAYACAHCNAHKGTDFATFETPNTSEITLLFNPRLQVWHEHFRLVEGQILGITSIGKSTSRLLNFNRVERVILRKELVEHGLM